MSLSSFYQKIAGLSYTGDFRMRVGGEDPKKLEKLVQAPGQVQRFNALYRPILDSYQAAGLMSIQSHNGNEDGLLEWDSKDPSTISYLCQQLPSSLRERFSSTNTSVAFTDYEVQFLTKALASIVAPAARNQSLKGIFTLGLRKSIRYANAKLSKGLFSSSLTTNS